MSIQTNITKKPETKKSRVNYFYDFLYLYSFFNSAAKSDASIPKTSASATALS